MSQDLHKTVFEGDNIDVLRGIDSNSIDLIYLDPPFNSNKTYAAPIGSAAAGAAFKDTWTLSDVDLIEHNRLKRKHPWLYALIFSSKQTHSAGMFSYLLMMSTRLFELQRILKSTGSIYLHCDPIASHYLKILMDGIFGYKNFRNEIVWRRATAHNDPQKYGNNTDRLLYYGGGEKITWNGHAISVKKTDEQLTSAYPSQDGRGRYRSDNLTGPSHGYSGGESSLPWSGYDICARGRVWSVPLKGSYAKWIEDHIIPNYRSINSGHGRLDALDSNGLIHHPKKGRSGWPGLKRYAVADTGNPVQALFTDIPGFTNYNKGKEWVGYPTQKPRALLERIIKASSNKGDLVLDPFCGCATTLVAAEVLKRRWCGIDLSPKAGDLVVSRIRQLNEIRSRKSQGTLDLLVAKVNHSDSLPIRTDIVREQADTPSKKRALKDSLYEEQDGLCNLCHTNFHHPRHFHMDHVVPKAKGGQDWIDNFQLLCGSCNSIKGTRTQEEARARLIALNGIDFSVFDQMENRGSNDYVDP